VEIKMTEIKIWVGNLGKYNEGELVGEWFDLPVSIEEITEVIGINEEYEEMFIADYEAPFSIGEYDSIENLNEIAEKMQGMDEDEIKAVSELVDNGIVSDFFEGLDELENVIFYHDCQDMEDVAHSWIHDHVGSIEDAVGDRTSFYFDHEAFKRDLEIDGYFDEIEEEQGEELDEDTKEAMAEELAEITTQENYFDYEAFGRDMDIEGTFFYMGQGVYIQYMN
jgi:antirestriction protein